MNYVLCPSCHEIPVLPGTVCDACDPQWYDGEEFEPVPLDDEVEYADLAALLWRDGEAA